VTTAIDATALTHVVTDGFENGLTGGFPWHTSPELPWSTTQVDKSEGSFSAQSHPVGSGDKSDLHVAIQSKHGGTLYFDFRPDVKMPYSGCYINIDNESKVGYTYPREWMALTLSIPPGSPIVMFRAWAPNIGKPASNPKESGTVFLDNVSFMPSLFENFEGDGVLEWNTVKFEGKQWGFDSTKFYEGKASFRSPTLGAKGKSSMKFEVIVPRYGADVNFYFYSGVASPQDKFVFKINNVMVKQSTTATEKWEQFTMALVPGTHDLEWVWEAGGGTGAVWIDNIGIVGKS
ncbi:hypothetical protein ACHAXR_001716, partial [Thalassiosira sp. AJA248-18]